MDKNITPIPSSSNFEKELKEYLHNTRDANNERAKMYIFLNFIKSAFKGINAGPAPHYFMHLEKYIKARDNVAVVKGYPDLLSGNLIIEFKKELTEVKLREAENQLKKYALAVCGKEERNRLLQVLCKTNVKEE